jgi:NAD(P)H-hydrate repair Nnr-like enzyme with NAD(P)H-hydrate epimerase domain
MMPKRANSLKDMLFGGQILGPANGNSRQVVCHLNGKSMQNISTDHNSGMGVNTGAYGVGTPTL